MALLLIINGQIILRDDPKWLFLINCLNWVFGLSIPCYSFGYGFIYVNIIGVKRTIDDEDYTAWSYAIGG